VFTVIVDDLVFPDGATKMGVLGGGGPQTAFGLRAHPSDLAVGLAAGVGPDLPEECLSWLRRNEVDDAGLALVVDRGEASEDAPAPASAPAWEGGALDASAWDRSPSPSSLAAPGRYRRTPRAWQITEPDGRRTQVWRTPPCPDLYAMLRPPASALPPSYLAARAFHVGVHPERPDLDLLAALRAANPEATISVEPFTAAARSPLPHDAAAALCRACDVFSPNESEAVSIVGPGDPRTLCERLAGLGARVVCLRRGENGSAAYDARGAGSFFTAPAFHRLGAAASGEGEGAVADVTGCGNAFCGAFLASLLTEGETIEDALAWGASAASLMAEAVGVPEEAAGDAGTREEARRRFRIVRDRVRKVE
jgi:sugar/nucleoside kinase (ribokinase family)